MQRVNSHPRPRIIFITGTDTGVGKTVLTALLLQHLRQTGCHALALKPFCSGGRADAELLYALQEGELSLDEINPFCFPEPVAPLIAARQHRRSLQLADVLAHIESVLSRQLLPAKNQGSKIENPVLLIEGAGGLLVPLGEGFAILELIHHLACEVIVVARNRLGTINHTLLTVRALQPARPANARHTQHAARSTPHPARVRVVLMDCNRADVSARSNASLLTELLAPVPLRALPFLGRNPKRLWVLKKNERKLKKTLALIAA